MKPSPITDEQAWQLFELLEGNLSKTAAAELHQAMQGDANLKAHYEALAQTYLQPTTTLYPDAPSLKKKTSNRTVLFYASMSVAASLVILWFFKASIATQNIAPIQSQIAKTSPSVDITTPSNTESAPPKPSLNRQGTKQNVATLVDRTQQKQTWETTSTVTENPNKQDIHPLIAATEPIRKVRNINDSVNTRKPSPNNSAIVVAQNDMPSPSIAQQKTRKELLKSFYLDARRMVENGHLPHVKVKTVNNDADWMPEFQVGLTLENNVILTSFNP